MLDRFIYKALPQSPYDTAMANRVHNEQQAKAASLDKQNKQLVTNAMQALEIDIGGNLKAIKQTYVLFSLSMQKNRGPNDLAERLKRFFSDFIDGVDDRIKTHAVATWLHRVSNENDPPGFRSYAEALQDESSPAFSIPLEAKKELICIIEKLRHTMPNQEPENLTRFIQLTFTWDE